MTLTYPGETGSLDRTQILIPEPELPTITTLDARETTVSPRFEAKALPLALDGR